MLAYLVPSRLDAPVPTTHCSLDGGGNLTFGQKASSRSSHTRADRSGGESSAAPPPPPPLAATENSSFFHGVSLRYRTVNLSSTSAPNQCPTAVHHCSNPQRATPDLICKPDSAHSESAAVPRQHPIKCLPGAKVRSRSLGQSARCLFGAWHHNIFTADCCFNGHSTKFASCGPPLRRASIGKGRG